MKYSKGTFLMLILGGISIIQAKHIFKKVETEGEHKKLNAMMHDHFDGPWAGCSGFASENIDNFSQRIRARKSKAHFVYHESDQKPHGFIVLTDSTNQHGERITKVDASDIGDAGDKQNRRIAMAKQVVDHTQKAGSHSIEAMICTREPDFNEQKKLFEDFGAKVTQSPIAADIYVARVSNNILEKTLLRKKQ